MKRLFYIAVILSLSSCSTIGTNLLPENEEDILGLTVHWRENTSEAQRSAIRNIVLDMVTLEESYFMMGATDEQVPYAEKDEFPAHLVFLSSYRIGAHSVRSDDVKAILEDSYPYLLDQINCYKEYASFTIDAAKEFIRFLSDISGLHIDLPTEARWEFAARGGAKSNSTVYVAGLNNTQMEKGELDGVSNELGIYGFGADGEWCKDMYAPYENKSLQADPCAVAGKGYVCRGINKTFDLSSRGMYPVRPSTRSHSSTGGVSNRLRLVLDSSINDNE